MRKVCQKCNSLKQITEFHKRGEKGTQPYCKKCSNDHKKRQYQIILDRK